MRINIVLPNLYHLCDTVPPFFPDTALFGPVEFDRQLVLTRSVKTRVLSRIRQVCRKQ